MFDILDVTSYTAINLIVQYVIRGGDLMKSITVRGIDPLLAEKLKMAAKKQSKSVNQFIIDMLKQDMGMRKQKKFTIIHHDLDHLFGKWSKNDFKCIQQKIDRERRIDKELWQ